MTRRHLLFICAATGISRIKVSEPKAMLRPPEFDPITCTPIRFCRVLSLPEILYVEECLRVKYGI